VPCDGFEVTRAGLGSGSIMSLKAVMIVVILTIMVMLMFATAHQGFAAA
jgi:hypothetical protein